MPLVRAVARRLVSGARQTWVPGSARAGAGSWKGEFRAAGPRGLPGCCRGGRRAGHRHARTRTRSRAAWRSRVRELSGARDSDALVTMSSEDTLRSAGAIRTKSARLPGGGCPKKTMDERPLRAGSPFGFDTAVLHLHPRRSTGSAHHTRCARDRVIGASRCNRQLAPGWIAGWMSRMAQAAPT